MADDLSILIESVQLIFLTKDKNNDEYTNVIRRLSELNLTKVYDDANKLLDTLKKIDINLDEDQVKISETKLLTVPTLFENPKIDSYEHEQIREAFFQSIKLKGVSKFVLEKLK